jgi:predicted ribosomally synthesized peptide with SipW-like signal peptide
MKGKKLILGIAALALVAVISVSATMAYLTSQDEVVNTFTVGKIAITLDEAVTNIYGEPLTARENGTVTTVDKAARDKANEYKLIPGHTYTKDPTVHVQPGSEKCYVFVKIVDDIAGIEAADTIASQVTSAANGWTVLDDENYPGVYYKIQNEVAKDADPISLKVFDYFKLTDTADVSAYAPVTTGESDSATTTYKTITVTAYAVQFDGFVDAKDAWSKTFGATNTNGGN